MDFNKKPIIGMLHMYGGLHASTIMKRDLEIFQKCGIDGYIIENYGGGLEEVVEGLKLIEGLGYESMYKGINILPNNFELAYALAAAYNLDFIQLDYISGNYENPRNPRNPVNIDVYHFEKFRKKFPEIKILGGVHPKYYKPIEGSNLMEDIQNAKKLCDAIVVTGAGTGKETPLDKIKHFKSLVGNDFPIIIGAGLDEFNVSEQLCEADGAIVGSYLKANGQAYGRVEMDRVIDFMHAVKKGNL